MLRLRVYRPGRYTVSHSHVEHRWCRGLVTDPFQAERKAASYPKNAAHYNDAFLPIQQVLTDALILVVDSK